MHGLGERIRLLAFAGAIGLAAPLMPGIASAQEAPRSHVFRFDIPAGAMSAVLARFSEITGVQLVYSADFVRNMQSAGLSGELSAPEALARVLEGTGLEARFRGDATASLVRVAERGARVLGPVRVEGAAGANGLHELRGVNGSTDPTATEASGRIVATAATAGAKGPTDLLNIPQSISVITREQLDKQNITTLDQAARYAPGLVYTPGSDAQGAQIASRGFTLSAIQINGGAPGAGGSYTSGQFGPIGLDQYDHIEILRGPDGLIAGNGSLAGPAAGTINLVQKRPLDHLQVLTELSAGSWDRKRAMLDITGPLNVLNLGGRFVATYEDQEFFYDDANRRTLSFYGILEAKPAEDLSLRIGATRNDFTERPWWWGLPRYSSGEDLDVPRSTSFVFPWNRANIDRTEYFVAGDYALRTSTLVDASWLFSLRASDSSYVNDTKWANCQGAINPVTRLGLRCTSFKRHYTGAAEAIDASATGDLTLLGVPVSTLIGYRLSTDGNPQNSEYAGASFAEVSSPFDFDPGLYPEPGDAQMYVTRTNLVSESETENLYFKLNVKVLGRLQLIAGGNRTSGESRSHTRSYLPPSMGGGIRVETRSYTRRQDALKPYYGLVYEIFPSLNTYVSYSDINAIGNIRYDRAGKALPPMHGFQYELGFKWRGLEDRLTASLSTYEINQTGDYTLDASVPQTTNPADGSSCCYFYHENNKNVSRGVDLEVAGNFSDELSGFFNYSLSDLFRRTVEVSEGPSFNTQFPEHVAKAWIQYEPKRLGKWAFALGGRYTSSYYVSGTVPTSIDPVTGNGVPPFIPFEFTENPYIVLDANVDFRVTGNITLSLAIQNLLDETYYEKVASPSLGNLYGAPRNATLRIRGKW